jgi:GT2 family glycosyltransferase
VAVDGDISGAVEPAAPATPDGAMVDVCIVSFNSAPVLADTIATIVDHLPAAAIAIREHGVDPGAIDALRRIVDAAPVLMRLEFDPFNPGFGAGCNALARGGHAPWVLFVNPDARILSWPWTATRRPPSHAVIGPLMDGAGQPERHSGVTYRITDEIKRSWFRRNGPRPDGKGFVSGAAMLIDRDSFERLGGFDERYFMFYEDIDLCLRANELGIETRIDTDWRVRHEGAHSTSRHFAESLIWSYESACRFHAERGERLWTYRAFVFVDSALRSVLHTARRNAAARSGYLRLARRTATDLLSRRTPASDERSETTSSPSR